MCVEYLPNNTADLSGRIGPDAVRRVGSSISVPFTCHSGINLGTNGVKCHLSSSFLFYCMPYCMAKAGMKNVCHVVQ